MITMPIDDRKTWSISSELLFGLDLLADFSRVRIAKKSTLNGTYFLDLMFGDALSMVVVHRIFEHDKSVYLILAPTASEREDQPCPKYVIVQLIDPVTIVTLPKEQMQLALPKALAAISLPAKQTDFERTLGAFEEVDFP